MDNDFLGIMDINAYPIRRGDNVRISVSGVINERRVTVAKGVIEYKGRDIGCLGCGYGILFNGNFMFLSTFSGRCEIEVQHE